MPAMALVNSGRGQVDLELHDYFSSSNDLTVTYPVAFPEALTRTQTASSGPGGYNEATYDVHNTVAGALMDVDVIAMTEPAADGGGGLSRFEITFTTTSDFDYELRANVDSGPFRFEANFAGVVASAWYDSGDGSFNGTFPVILDGGGSPMAFDEFVDTGHLVAGTYTFSVEAKSGLTRYGTEHDTTGAATLTLVPEPVSVGIFLLGVGALTLVRRRHS
jgi:hypothetical protein